MKVLRALALVALAAIIQPAGAQEDLAGFRHVGPGQVAATNASFSIGLSRDGGSSFVTTAAVSDEVELRGIVRPDPAHIGMTGDIFVVDRVNTTTFTMRNAEGVFVNWNGNIATLVPVMEDVPLTAAVTVNVFTGALGVEGNHRLFLGYLPANGALHYNINGHSITVSGTSPLQAAQDYFATAIATQIVPTCFVCHSQGGQAASQAQQRFVSSSNPAHLSINFNEFVTLESRLGKAAVLTKVRGGNLHGGGTILTTTSQDYRNLEQFLTLLEQL